MAQACQILDLDSHGVLHLDLRHLRTILMKDEIKNKLVCVVSITGLFRQGKSFLMNLVIPYLKQVCNEKHNVENWLRESNGTLQRNFAWRSGANPHTNGIYMYPEVFLGKNSSGEEVAIVLLDTQGTFDTKTSVNNCSKIFALSTLISSLQIYNIKDCIKQYDFEHLEYFASHGNRVRDASEDTPFQHLLFLIRDWSNEHEQDFGTDGGQDYLDYQLNEHVDQNENLVELKRNVKKLFQKISCFLMPFPGMKVHRFNGDVLELEAKFVEFVEKFARDFLHPTKLPVKTINDKKITVSELFHIIEDYCELFRREDVPQLLSVVEVTAEVQFRHSVEKSMDLYHSIMNILKNLNDEGHLTVEALEKRNRTAREQAVQLFETERTIQREYIKERYRQELLKKLDEGFDLCRDMNDLRYFEFQVRKAREEESLKIHYEHLVTGALSRYDKLMVFMKDKNQEALTDDQISLKHSEACQKVRDNFEEGRKPDNSEIDGKYLEELETKLKAKYEECQAINSIKRKMEAIEEKQRREAEAEFSYGDAMEEALFMYDDAMTSLKNGVDDAVMEQKNKSARTKALNHFKSRKDRETAELFEKYERKLEKGLNVKFREYFDINSKQVMKNQLDEAVKTVAQLQKELLDNKETFQKRTAQLQQAPANVVNEEQPRGSPVFDFLIHTVPPIVNLLTALITRRR